MDERRMTRRVFFGDLWFLGAGLLGSVAWGWANVGSAAEPVASPTPQRSHSPHYVDEASPCPATPQPVSSTKPRTAEFDHEMPAGGISNLPPPTPTPRPRTNEFDHPPVPGKPAPPPR